MRLNVINKSKNSAFIQALILASVAINAQGKEQCLVSAETSPHIRDRSNEAVPLARGGEDVIKEPADLGQVYQAMPDSAKGKGGPNFRATILVHFHVISDGEIGDVTQAQIDEQMRILNKSFSDSKTGFNFELADVTRTDNAVWFYAGQGGKEERAMKKALTQGVPFDLNYYSTTAGGYLGWAYLPGLSDPSLYLDGIVIDWESMKGTSTRYEGVYDLGLTAVHEAGHWLNLEHTFAGGCNANGDYVDDTPAQKIATRGCPAGKDTCKAPGLDPIHNYMDYSDDSCYTEFTPGQSARMQDSYLFFREP